MNNIAIIIPARMKSVRFPRKPLAKIGQLPMIHHVYNRAVEAELNIPIYVATDSTDILDYCNSQNIQTVHTGNHSTGTDRVFEAAQKIGFEYAINLQVTNLLCPLQHFKQFLLYFLNHHLTQIISSLLYVRHPVILIMTLILLKL